MYPESRSNQPLTGLLTALIAIGSSRVALGENKTWDGGGGDDNWTTGANWRDASSDDNTVPLATDHVFFNSTYNTACIINENIQVASFTVSTGHSATITHDQTPPTGHGAWMIVTGDLTLHANARFTAPPGQLFVGGKIDIGSSATFTNAPTGTVILAAAATPSTSVFGGATFNNLIIADALPVTSGLVSRWKLDDSANDNADDDIGANDLIEHASGVLIKSQEPGPLAAGGTSFNYGDAADNYIHHRTTVSATDLRTNVWSLSAWTRVDNADAGGCSDLVNVAGNYYIQVCNDAVANYGEARVVMVSTVPTTHTCPSSNNFNMKAGDPGESVWTHVVGTNDGTRLTVYLNGVKTVCAAHNQTTRATSTYIALGGAGNSDNTRQLDGRLDEVRAYNRALTDAEALALYTGAVETAGTVSHASTGTFIVNDQLFIGSGTFAPAGNLTVTGLATVAGNLTIGALTATFNGGLDIEDPGTLTMGSTSAIVSMGASDILNMDGSLVSATGSGASKPTIQAVSGNYYFRVGSVANATPILNVNGLYVRDVTADGLFVNYTAGAVTAVTRFDNVRFTHGADGATNPLLQFAGDSLDVKATGLSFDNSSASYAEKNVKVTDRHAGSANDVKVVIGATCVSETDCDNDDVDDDATNDGVADAGGGVVYWVNAAHTDHAGVIEGFPVVSFNWTSFVYNATYVAYNNVTGGKDRLYKRAADGSQVLETDLDPFYFELPSDDDFVGPPRWIHSGGNFYVYVITKAGRVYRLQDTATGFSQTHTFQDGASAGSITPLAMDSSNLYWVGNSGSAANTTLLFKVTQATLGSKSASAGVGDVDTGNAIPVITRISGADWLLFGTSGALYKWNLVNLSTPTFSTQPTADVFGRVSALNGIAYFADYRGKIWAVNAQTLATVTGGSWPFQDTTSAGHSNTICNVNATPNNCSVKNIFANVLDIHVYFGDYDGHLFAVKSDGTELFSNFPMLLESGTNVFDSAPFYRNGIIAIGSRTGNVYFVDRNNGSNQPALLKTLRLGSAVASISFDHETSNYLIATENGQLVRMAEILDGNAD